MSCSAPRSVVWVFTARCPLKCVHCYASMYVGERELSLAEAKRVVEGFAELGVEHVHITGGDPVAVRPSDVVEIARLCRSLGVGVSVFTSCVAIPRPFLEGVKLLDAVYTSVDGFDKRSFEAVRGAGSWDRFLEGYKLVRDAASYVHVNITISAVNHGVVDRVLRFVIEKLEPNSVSVIPAMDCGRARINGVAIDAQRFAKALERVDSVARELGVFVECWCTPFAKLIGRNLVSSTCRGACVVDLTPSGNIVLCDVINYVVSNVVEKGVEGAWGEYVSSEAYRKATSIPRACARCRYLATCGGGCFARSYLAYGELDRGDPLCPFASSAIP